MAQKGGARPGAGRKKGGLASHTLQAQTAKAKAIAMVEEKIQQIFAPQIAKAIEGDTAAFNAVLNRAWGAPAQAVTGAEGKDLPTPILNVFAHYLNTKDTETE